jgi:hypothetical protein
MPVLQADDISYSALVGAYYAMSLPGWRHWRFRRKRLSRKTKDSITVKVLLGVAILTTLSHCQIPVK